MKLLKNIEKGLEKFISQKKIIICLFLILAATISFADECVDENKVNYYEEDFVQVNRNYGGYLIYSDKCVIPMFSGANYQLIVEGTAYAVVDACEGPDCLLAEGICVDDSADYESYACLAGCQFGACNRDTYVTLDFFKMSLCPFAENFEPMLEEIVDEFEHYVEFSPNFIVTKGEGTNCVDGYCALHGAPELELNKVQYCINQELGLKEYFEFVEDIDNECLDLINNTDNLIECLHNAKIELSDIEDCLEADNILDLIVNNTNEFGIFSSPTLLIDNVEYEGLRDYNSIKDAICVALDNVPEICDIDITSCDSDLDCETDIIEYVCEDEKTCKTYANGVCTNNVCTSQIYSKTCNVCEHGCNDNTGMCGNEPTPDIWDREFSLEKGWNLIPIGEVFEYDSNVDLDDYILAAYVFDSKKQEYVDLLENGNIMEEIVEERAFTSIWIYISEDVELTMEIDPEELDEIVNDLDFTFDEGWNFYVTLPQMYKGFGHGYLNIGELGSTTIIKDNKVFLWENDDKNWYDIYYTDLINDNDITDEETIGTPILMYYTADFEIEFKEGLPNFPTFN